MPREVRKRGRRHKKDDRREEEGNYQLEVVENQRQYNHHHETNQIQNQERGGKETNSNHSELTPSWIIPAASRSVDNDGFNPEAPFGYVDMEVKAYFRTVDVQIRDWQESKGEQEEREGEEENRNEDIDPNEERRLFFMAALTEMHGKEKQLATDPDCSIILERMAYSMDDFVRRVFMDSMAGSYEVMVRHRFASHVCQTLFSLCKETIAREVKGIYPKVSGTQEEEKGELRTLTQLILDICEELLPTLPDLIMDPFGSHVIRSLLALLSPNLTKEDSSLLRSKKSAAWKAKQGPMSSVFEKGKAKETPKVPVGFQNMARKFVEILRSKLDENEVRAMAANKVASPGLQMLLEVEADQGLSNEPGSLMDRVTFGIITACSEGETPTEPSDYLNTLLRDTTSSHLLEAIISRCPEQIFNVIWNLYLNGKLHRLSIHPVANFVVAKALERASEEQLAGTLKELEESWSKIIATSRSGVLKAAIDRAAKLQALGDETGHAVFSAFELKTEEERMQLVPCALVLLPLKEYQRLKVEAPVPTSQKPTHPHGHGRGRAHQHQHQHNPLEPKIQGSLLLQSLLQLPEPHYQIVTNSLKSLSMEERISLAHNSVSSRVYDVLFTSTTISAKVKRGFVMDFIGFYHVLVDDRFGSRVVDRCWDFVDTYLKEKIARSLLQHEQFLVGSFYGKFFNRNLNLYLLQRKPEQWRTFQSERKKQMVTGSNGVAQNQSQSQNSNNTATSTHETQSPKKKRKRQEDEIDALFNASLGKKVKKSALVLPEKDNTTKPKDGVDEGEGEGGGEGEGDDKKRKEKKKEKKKDSGEVDKGLEDVLGAIKNAPKNEKSKSEKRKRK